MEARVVCYHHGVATEQLTRNSFPLTCPVLLDGGQRRGLRILGGSEVGRYVCMLGVAESKGCQVEIYVLLYTVIYLDVDRHVRGRH